MSDTPRTNAADTNGRATLFFTAQQLERELAAMTKERDALLENNARPRCGDLRWLVEEVAGEVLDRNGCQIKYFTQTKPRLQQYGGEGWRDVPLITTKPTP